MAGKNLLLFNPVNIKTYKSPKGINAARKRCLDYRLHEFGDEWTLKEILSRNVVKEIRIAYDEGKPVGCAVEWFELGEYGPYNKERAIVSAFVIPNKRRKGIGSKLVAKSKGVRAYTGEDGSKYFWVKNEIKIA